MALISFVFIILFILLAAVLLGMLTGGVILIVVGGIKLRAHKRNGEPLVPAVISLVLGILIALVPLTVAGLIIAGIIETAFF